MKTKRCSDLDVTCITQMRPKKKNPNYAEINKTKKNKKKEKKLLTMMIKKTKTNKKNAVKTFVFSIVIMHKTFIYSISRKSSHKTKHKHRY